MIFLYTVFIPKFHPLKYSITLLSSLFPSNTLSPCFFIYWNDSWVKYLGVILLKLCLCCTLSKIQVERLVLCSLLVNQVSFILVQSNSINSIHHTQQKFISEFLEVQEQSTGICYQVNFYFVGHKGTFLLCVNMMKRSG